MKSNRWIGTFVGVALFATAMAGQRGQADPSGPRWYTDLPSAAAASKKDQKPMLVCFLSRTCGPCTAYRKAIFPTAEFQKSVQNLILVYVDFEGNPKLAKKYGVKETPDIRLYSPSGKQISRLVGFNRKALFATLKKAVGNPRI